MAPHYGPLEMIVLFIKITYLRKIKDNDNRFWTHNKSLSTICDIEFEGKQISDNHI